MAGDTSRTLSKKQRLFVQLQRHWVHFVVNSDLYIEKPGVFTKHDFSLECVGFLQLCPLKSKEKCKYQSHH